jgi:hypothetical protein
MDSLIRTWNDPDPCQKYREGEVPVQSKGGFSPLETWATLTRG